jgi:hypothetical protein
MLALLDATEYVPKQEQNDISIFVVVLPASNNNPGRSRLLFLA